MHKTKYLLVVNHIVSSVFESVEELSVKPEFKNLQVLVITKNNQLPIKYSRFGNNGQFIVCDLSSEAEIAKALKPYRSDIVGVICRGDKHIQYLRKIIPYLPTGVLVSSPESLEVATDKGLMRRAFEKYPEITPQWIEAKDSSDETIDQVEAKLNYPVIIKPANLFSSLLIRSCESRAELKEGLLDTFKNVKMAYSKESMSQSPQIIVEEFLEGDFYSTDVFVLDKKIYYTPLIGYIPAKKLGIDDFFLYKRFAPVDLSEAETKAARIATEKALDAVGLKFSAAHVELIRTSSGWRIIELGPRLGRFRNIMYRFSYGINLSLNDVKIHLGLEPDLPDKLIEYCAAYSIYPKKEGILKEVKGMDELKQNQAVKSLRVLATVGDKCLLAKNGGHAIAEFVVTAKDEKEFERLCHFIESRVYADID